jgi:hypothetical protein
MALYSSFCPLSAISPLHLTEFSKDFKLLWLDVLWLFFSFIGGDPSSLPHY